MGQGSDTAMAQIVAEVLDVRAEDVRVVHPDTDVTPYDMATLGSRSTFHMGNAVKLAAEHARQQILDLARSLGLPEGSNLPVKELFKKKYGMQAGNILGVGSFIPDYISPDSAGLSENITPFWMVGGTGVELEVDTETGRIRLTRLINVADLGACRLTRASLKRSFRVLRLCRSASRCWRIWSLMAAKSPMLLRRLQDSGMHDIPRNIENHIVLAEQGGGPFGAKGVGESATFGVSPAIANAIDDAVGVRLT